MNKEEKEVARKAVFDYRMAKIRTFITPEAREKARLARIGQKRTEETRDKIRQKAIGRKHTPETIQKIREARQKQKITEPMLKALANNRGENSLLWKGKNASYRTLHKWVEKHLGKPTQCEHCSKNNLKSHYIHWANKSGEYKRELDDWVRLCALCHKRYDREQKFIN